MFQTRSPGPTAVPSIAATVLEVSREGLIVESDQRLTVGARFTVGGSLGIAPREPLQGCVIFSDPRPNSARFVMGLRFTLACAAHPYHSLQLLAIGRKSVLQLSPERPTQAMCAA